MSTKPFFSILVTDDAGETITEVPIDVIGTRNYKYGATVTDFPIEAGSTGTDHRKKNPDEISLEGMVSGSPLDSASLTQNLGLRGDGGNQAQGQGFTPIMIQTAHDMLLDLHEKGTLVEIQTEYRLHKNMSLTELSIARSKTTGLALDFTATFKQEKIVTTAASALPASVVKSLKQKSTKPLTKAQQKRYVQLSTKNEGGKLPPDESSELQKLHAQLTASKSG